MTGCSIYTIFPRHRSLDIEVLYVKKKKKKYFHKIQTRVMVLMVVPGISITWEYATNANSQATPTKSETLQVGSSGCVCVIHRQVTGTN